MGRSPSELIKNQKKKRLIVYDCFFFVNLFASFYGQTFNHCNKFVLIVDLRTTLTDFIFSPFFINQHFILKSLHFVNLFDLKGKKFCKLVRCECPSFLKVGAYVIVCYKLGNSEMEYRDRG